MSDGIEDPLKSNSGAISESDRAMYLVERAALAKKREDLGWFFDKSRIVITAGALALSAILMKPFGVFAPLIWPKIIYFWVFLVFSLFCSLLSLYLAGLSRDCEIELLDADKRAGIEFEKRLRPRERQSSFNRWLGILNILSIVLLAAGLALFAWAQFGTFSGSFGTQ